MPICESEWINPGVKVRKHRWMAMMDIHDGCPFDFKFGSHDGQCYAELVQ